jgi:hypothetical protein
MTVTIFQTVASELANAFETRKRADGEKYTAIREGAPAWLQNIAYEAHQAVDERMPDDWIYSVTREIASALADCGCETADEASHDGQDCDIAIEACDIYTTDLTKWLSSNLANVALCNEAMSEGLCDGLEFSDIIRQGQFIATQRIVGCLLYAIGKECEAREACEVCDEVQAGHTCCPPESEA